MDTRTFLERALQEGQRYGDDDWVFLRELTQNARDAGATCVDVTTALEGGHEGQRSEVLRFTDDGRGMSFEHARRYLLRLYASSKERDPRAAGHFGVGFWAVLRWRPAHVLVESRTAAGAWALRIDVARGEVERAACTLTSAHGTRVTLARSGSDGQALSAQTRERLRHYCRYVRRAGRGDERLALWVDGERVDEPMELEGPVVLHFRGAGARGVVGLGPEPRVELYARGLWVTTVSFLEELEPGARAPATPHNVGGLSPVVILSSDDLDVVLSRQAPVESRALRRLVRLGRSRVRRLVGHVVDRACPRPPSERLRDAIAAMVGALGGPALAAIVGVWLLLGAGLLVWLLRDDFAGPVGSLEPAPVLAGEGGGRRSVQVRSGPPGRPESSGARSLGVDALEAPEPAATSSAPRPSPRPYTGVRGYGGARVDVPAEYGPGWGLTYRGGPAALAFKALTLDAYDPQRGWVRAPEGPLRPYAGIDCRARDDCIEVKLVVASPGGDPILLPLPTGYGLDARTLRLDGGPVELGATAWDEPIWTPPALVIEPRVFAYQAGPARSPAPPPPRGAPVALPVEMERSMARFEDQGRLAKVRGVTELVRGWLLYDFTPGTARAFGEARGDWLSRVLAVGAGDCDVKNGVNVLALQQLGVPARLAVGIPARRDGSGAVLHAWTEYHARGRWRDIDASGTASAPSVALLRTLRYPSEPSPGTVAQVGAPATGSAEVARAAVERDGGARSGRLDRGSAPHHGAGGGRAGSSAGRHGAVPAKVASPAREADDVASRVLAAAREGDDVASRVLASPAREADPMRWAWLLAVVFPLVVVGGLAHRMRSRIRERIETGGGHLDDVEARALARMLRDALWQPAAWRSAAHLWERRVLPTLRGRRMSLHEAIERARSNILWVTRRRGELASLAAAAGTPVLDGSHPIFGDVVAALGRGVDLDGYDTLRPSDDVAAPAVVSLVAAGNRVLDDAGAGVRCVVTPGLHGAAVQDVDLSGLRLPRRSPWPRRFIAVNPRSPSVGERAELTAVDPSRAVFLWLDWLLDRSELLAEHAAETRRRGALKALGGVRS